MDINYNYHKINDETRREAKKLRVFPASIIWSLQIAERP